MQPAKPPKWMKMVEFEIGNQFGHTPIVAGKFLGGSTCLGLGSQVPRLNPMGYRPVPVRA